MYFLSTLMIILHVLFSLLRQDVSVSTPVLGGGGNDVHKDFLEMWVEFLTSHARSPQLLDASHPVVVGLEQALGRYTDDVTTLSHHAEKTCVCVVGGRSCISVVE